MNSLPEFVRMVKSRRSIRRFLPNSIPNETLEKLIEAAIWAPSAGNLQDWTFTIVTSESVLKKMVEVVKHRWKVLLGDVDNAIMAEVRRHVDNFLWFSSAKTVVVISVKRTETFLRALLNECATVVLGRRISAAMAAQNLMLAAYAAGLGSCCLTGPLVAEKDLKEILCLGRRREIVCLVALGWPDEKPDPPDRKAVKEITKIIE